MAECMNRRTRRARAACARVRASLPCSRPRGCHEKPAPLEIMSRAVRIAARRLSACLTALPKSLPNPSARLELDLFSMVCSHEIFTDQSHHAWIRSEKNPSIRSDACMTPDYARGHPVGSAWPLAGQPCKVESDLHTIARAHNRTFFVRLLRAL